MSQPDNLVKELDQTRTQEEQLLNAPYGQQGAVVISAEDKPVVGEFYCIIALRDDVVLQTTGSDVNWGVLDGLLQQATPWQSAGSLQNIPLPVGLPFYGKFSSIILADMSAVTVDHCPHCPKVIAYFR